MANNILQVKDLHVKYGSIQALKGINIEVPLGSIVALLGSNGAGKSTLLRTISRIVDVDSGDIFYEGQSIKNIPAEKISSHKISHCPEGRQVFGDITVLENLLVGGFTVTSNKEKLERIEECFNMFPVLRERKNQVAGTLSGGEQQMLVIARALMLKPKLLILDEPSLGLAPIIVKNVFDNITKINKAGTTVLISEQNALQTLKISDYVYVLEVGKVTMSGKAEEMIKNDKLIHAYLGKH